MILLLVLLASASSVSAQDLSVRGFGEVQSTVYPLTTHQDADRVAVEGRFRFEPAFRPVTWLTLSGSLDARVDNLEQVDREWRLDVDDRGEQRPALSLRHAAATSLRLPRTSSTA